MRLKILAWCAAMLSVAAATQKSAGLKDPAKKEIAMQLVSTAENSSLDWKAQYGYIEYNVEGNDDENRGYTGGIVGFTSATHSARAGAAGGPCHGFGLRMLRARFARYFPAASTFVIR